MPQFIVKLSEGQQSWYLLHSTVVDAPITYGMSLDQFKKFYQEEYGRQGMEELEKRLARVEAKGTSSMMHASAEDAIDWNRAGKDGTCLSIQQIIDFYCKHPEWKTQEEFEAYDKGPRPMGKKMTDDD